MKASWVKHSGPEIHTTLQSLAGRPQVVVMGKKIQARCRIEESFEVKPSQVGFQTYVMAETSLTSL